MLRYIANRFPHTDSAMFKSRTDMDTILDEECARNVGLRVSRPAANKVTDYLRNLATAWKLPFSIGRGNILVVQYPTSLYKAACRAAHFRRAKVVTLIHDLECFKRPGITPAEEIKLLQKSDFLITLNPAMDQWLRDNGNTVGSTVLGIWDYLSPEAREARVSADNERDIHRTDPPRVPDSYTVMFVGGVSRRRNQFLYDWGQAINGYKVVIYGNNFDTTQAANPERFRLRGFTPSGLMIRHPEGDFGLVWDGDSLDGCRGRWGDYLKYTNPHKTSLYLRCGVPVIIWKHAGLAPFVEKEGIGFTIDSLKEISERLRQLTPEEYARMKANVARVSARIASGAYFREALARAVEQVAPKALNELALEPDGNFLRV